MSFIEMIIKSRALLGLLVLSVLLPGLSRCSSQDAGSLEGIAALDSLLRDAPKTVVDLDVVSTEKIYPDLIVGNDPLQPNRPYLAEPYGSILLYDSLYITDRKNHVVSVADGNGRVTREIGRQGQGPGEFNGPADMAKNRMYAFVYDVENRRIQVFDHSFRYVASIPAGFHFSWADMTATDAHLFVPNTVGDRKLVTVYEAKPPFRSIHKFTPQLVSLEQQPLAYNQVRLAANENNVFVAYTALPYIFVFDSDFNHVNTLELSGETVEQLRNASPEGMRVGPGNPIPVQSFFRSLAVDEQGAIYFVRGLDVFILRKSGNEYTLDQKIRVHYPSGVAVDREGVIPMLQAIYTHQEQLYASVMFEPYVMSFYPNQRVAEALSPVASTEPRTNDFKVPDQLLQKINLIAEAHRLDKAVLLFHGTKSTDQVMELITTFSDYANEKGRRSGVIIVLISDVEPTSKAQHPFDSSQVVNIIHWQDQEGQMRAACVICGEEGTAIINAQTGELIERFPYFLGPYTLFDRIAPY